MTLTRDAIVAVAALQTSGRRCGLEVALHGDEPIAHCRNGLRGSAGEHWGSREESRGLRLSSADHAPGQSQKVSLIPSSQIASQVSVIILWCGALPFSWYVSGWRPVQQGIHPGTSHEKEEPHRNRTTEHITCWTGSTYRSMRFADAPMSSKGRLGRVLGCESQVNLAPLRLGKWAVG
ncbi:hypothetical protein K466DRAFT_131559 [Polyporus arcularius HHB13444]|uniref:Uncharacterized protein n=1 Tax=Polyporus arcularius HHB13444 TaxID=1314778 RepID=A0A5C3PDJ8_9APHY|nr:hypothetical protein K466DRAFT_131559 [Polyporus arcularius HHB13444]